MMTIIGIAIISVRGLNILNGYCGQISIGHAGFMAVGAYTSSLFLNPGGWLTGGGLTKPTSDYGLSHMKNKSEPR